MQGFKIFNNLHLSKKRREIMYKEKHKHVQNAYRQQHLGICQYLKVMSVMFRCGIKSFTLSQVIGHHTDR